MWRLVIPGARRALLLVLVSVSLLAGVPALAGTPGQPTSTVGPAASPIGSPAANPTVASTVVHGGAPPGERHPLEGALAVLAILVVGAAGFFIYGVIRKGL